MLICSDYIISPYVSHPTPAKKKSSEEQVY